VKQFGVTTLQHSIANVISTTDMSCFTIILGIFAHIKYVLFPFSLLYFDPFPSRFHCKP